jgi:endonuclease/exonuclease/phosphatase family metal-dependent hydrolase
VLLLQEMGRAPYLEELRQDLSREGCVYEHSYVLEAADSERHVAVLSRLPLARITPHAEIAFTYFGEKELVKRGLLELTFDSPTGEWTVFAVHLKSRYTDRPDDPESAKRRAFEAEEVRDLILKRFPDPATARFAIAGDFNDVTNSRPLAALRHRGKTMISRLVPTADSRGETWTYRYLAADAFSRADFILVSPGLWPCVAGERGTVHDGAGSLEGSDHRMVYLDLDFEAAKSAVNEKPSSDETSDDGNENQTITGR